MVSKTILSYREQILFLSTYPMKLCECKRVKNQNKLKHKCGDGFIFFLSHCHEFPGSTSGRCQAIN